MRSKLVWWGNPEVAKGNEQAILDLLDKKIENAAISISKMMNDIYEKDIMSRGSSNHIICNKGFYALFRKAFFGKRLKKARKRRLRNEYLQRRARA